MWTCDAGVVTSNPARFTTEVLSARKTAGTTYVIKSTSYKELGALSLDFAKVWIQCVRQLLQLANGGGSYLELHYCRRDVRFAFKFPLQSNESEVTSYAHLPSEFRRFTFGGRAGSGTFQPE